MENRNGQGIFYGVIGVATLVVAIIGATFAYFSATGANNNTTVAGNTAEAVALDLTVSRVSPIEANAAGKLVPLNAVNVGENETGANVKTIQMGAALTASCFDGSNVTCHVYSVTVTSDSNASLGITSTINLSSQAPNIHWMQLTDATHAKENYTSDDIKDAGSDVAFVSDTLDATHKSRTYYFVVWVEETNASQGTDANKQFSGTVSFNVTGNNGTSGLTATFS